MVQERQVLARSVALAEHDAVTLHSVVALHSFAEPLALAEPQIDLALVNRQGQGRIFLKGLHATAQA